MTATVEQANGITRREFLYYIWGASIALYLGQFGGIVIWFALPRIKEGTFGGIFPVDANRLPKPNDPPYDEAQGRFWLANVDSTEADNPRMYKAVDEGDNTGVLAIYKVCTHLGCIYAWNNDTNRFECPCHGSKYRLDGRRIQDPAPRNLDRFPVVAVDADDAQIKASAVSDSGEVLPLTLTADELSRVARFRVDTGTRTDGLALTLLRDLTG